MAILKRIRGALASIAPAFLGGGFYLQSMTMLLGEHPPPGSLLMGGLYGLGVLGLMRLFPVARWAYPFTGFICGPVPLVLFRDAPREDVQGLVALTALFGIVLGFLEWARLTRRDAKRASAD